MFDVVFFPLNSMAYAKMNKNAEAEEAYKNALRLDPENADYQNNLSVTQQRIQESRLNDILVYFTSTYLFMQVFN